MAENRRGCAPAQQSMCSSNPLAFTSRLSAVAAELLISRHAPCHKHLFLVQKFYSRRIPRDYRENHHNSCEKTGIPANSFSTREGRSDALMDVCFVLFLVCLYICVCKCQLSNIIQPTFMCLRSIAGVLFDLVRRFRATLLLRTTCMRL